VEEAVVNEEDEKLAAGLDSLVRGDPVKHECENCGDAGMAPPTTLPRGWRYLSESGNLIHSEDELDRKTIIVCAICFGLVSKVITVWKEKP
jgi:hypothetical protein